MGVAGSPWWRLTSELTSAEMTISTHGSACSSRENIVPGETPAVSGSGWQRLEVAGTLKRAVGASLQLTMRLAAHTGPRRNGSRRSESDT